MALVLYWGDSVDLNFAILYDKTLNHRWVTIPKAVELRVAFIGVEIDKTQFMNCTKIRSQLKPWPPVIYQKS